MATERAILGFASSPRFVEHITGPQHPERPDRIRAIHTALHASELIATDPFPEFRLNFGPLQRFQSRTTELQFGSADSKWVEMVHSPRYLQYVKHVCELGGVLDQGDTPVGPASFEIALLALGAVLRCCDAVMNQEVRRAFAAVRPPGHHAEPERPMGFCLFSNVAIAARYLQRQFGVERIGIVDFDVHHGNGTQACLEAEGGTMFISLHQHPATCYPGSGYEWEIGTGRGRGHIMNIPLDPGCGDAEYTRVMESRVVPALDEFRPEFLLISAGFDAHLDDPLAQMEVSEEGFELMTRALAAVADLHCGGRIVSCLEGGYNLTALGRSVVRHLAGLGAV